jgi:hypothetical protein
VILLDTGRGFNPRVATLLSAAPACGSTATAGALWNITDLTGGLSIGQTATGTGTTGASVNLIECNGTNWIVATGTTGGIPYPGAGVPLSTGSAWGTSYAVGTAANDLVQLNGSGALPAVSGANLTSLPGVTSINGVSGALSGINHTSTLPCTGTQVFTNGLLTSVTGSC